MSITKKSVLLLICFFTLLSFQLVRAGLMWDCLFCQGCGLVFDYVGLKAHDCFKGACEQGMDEEIKEGPLRKQYAVFSIAYVSLGVGWHILGLWAAWRKIRKRHRDAKLVDEVRDDACFRP